MVESTATDSSFSINVVALAFALIVVGLSVALAVGGVVVYRRRSGAGERAAAVVAVAGGLLVLATLVTGGAELLPSAAVWPLLLLELGLLGTTLWVWMLVDCAINEPRDGNDKLIWVLIILFAQVLGATLYLLVRRPQRLATARS
ncbi:MAG: PLDc_N domain-containing protein [Chloroflexi bacterium]|nr:PLDc_N domain-containing protein [Chloroflexota bacterium]